MGHELIPALFILGGPFIALALIANVVVPYCEPEYRKDD